VMVSSGNLKATLELSAFRRKILTFIKELL